MHACMHVSQENVGCNLVAKKMQTHNALVMDEQDVVRSPVQNCRRFSAQ